VTPAAGFRRGALAAGLFLLAGAAARAAPPLAVLSSDSPHYREAFAGFEEAWGSTVPFVVLGRDRVPAEPGTVVAFGSRAALRDWPDGTGVVSCLAPGARPWRGPVVDLMPDPSALVARLQDLIPSLKVLRVLWSSDSEGDAVADLARAARARGVTVRSEQILEPADLPERLRSLHGRADALWIMPDPAFVNARNFAILREYAAASRVPFLAPTQGLERKGATATVAATFREAGRAAARTLREDGAFGSRRVHPGRLTVTVSAEQAARTGLDLRRSRGVDEVSR
jgi:hypothetical protein